MAPDGFRLGGTSIDRAGGLLRLRAIADDLVGKGWSLVRDEIPGYFVLVVVNGDGEVIEELESVAIARSASIRIDQEDLLEGDLLALEPILRAEVERRTFARLPESEKRLLDGNR